MVGKAWWQEREAAGRMASAARRQRGERGMLYGCFPRPEALNPWNDALYTLGVSSHLSLV